MWSVTAKYGEFMSLNIAKLRDDTPGCNRVIHFNNAGASLMPAPVLSSIKTHLDLEATIGGYEAAERANEQISRTYDLLARLLGCRREEIAVIENATRAWDMAFYAIPFAEGDRILTSMAEYASNYIAYLQVARRYGVRIEVIPNDEFGQISLEALQRRIDSNTKVISLTHVPTNGGLVNPAAEVGKIARRHNILYILDACQSAGQMPLRVDELGCDVLSSTGRKYLRGPRGTGFLYVRETLIPQLEPPLLDLHAAEWTTRDTYKIREDARRFENWETYYAGKIGLGVAVEYALDIGLSAIQERVFSLAAELRAKLSEIPLVVVRDRGELKCGIVTFTIENRNLHDISRTLRTKNINVIATSRPYTRLDMESRGLEDLLRASLHYYNTAEEMDIFCEVLRSLI